MQRVGTSLLGSPSAIGVHQACSPACGSLYEEYAGLRLRSCNPSSPMGFRTVPLRRRWVIKQLARIRSGSAFSYSRVQLLSLQKVGAQVGRGMCLRHAAVARLINALAQKYRGYQVLHNSSPGGLTSCMSEFQALYSTVKEDLASVATPLMEFGEQQVKKHGAFLPFGASLSASGEVSLQAVADGEDVTTSAALLPLLLEALASLARGPAVRAVACAEWVSIQTDGGPKTDAIKVSVHHVDGIAVAFHVPATKKMFRGWSFGDTALRRGDAIVPGWSTGPAT